MNTENIIDILNELLAIEQGRLATRLMESRPFVPPLSAGALRTIERMAGQSKEHDAWLVEAISILGGVPGLRMCDAATADLHYQRLDRAFPRLLADHEELTRKYALAAERVAAEPQAASVVQRILARHRDDLDVLRQLGAGG